MGWPSEARLAHKLLDDLNLTHVHGLRQRFTELGLSRRQLQKLQKEKNAVDL